MDKFINAFSRTPHKKDDEGRSHQFAKRLATSTSTPFITNKTPGPILPSSELSPMEEKVYGAWWDKLDPFGLGVVVDEALLPFLLASGLSQDILQQIIDFYVGEAHYLEDQFYAILRLVGHSQSGRKINRDLVVLGAPLASFNPDTLDSLLNQENNTKNTSNDNKNTARNTWWGHSLSSQKETSGTSLFGTMENQQQQPIALASANNHRHSYAGSTLSTSAFLSPPMPAVNAIETQPSWAAPPHTPSIPASQYSNQGQTNAFAWAEKALTNQHQQHPFKSNQTSTNTTDKNIHTHSRSRSVPYASQDMPSASDFIFDTITATQSKQDQSRPMLVTSRSSMDATAFNRLSQQEQQYIDHGQSLLLTQKFVPPSSTTKSTNPFEDNDDDGGKDDDDDEDSNKNEHIDDSHTSTPDIQQSHLITKSPFDDTTQIDNTGYTATDLFDSIIPAASPRVTPATTDPGKLAFPTRVQKVNLRSNKLNIPPPPVPPQSSKPAHPRYVRNQPLKRSQSQHSGQKHLPFMSQGAFLLATSSAASSVQFPTVPPSVSLTMPFDDTTRLFRHRSTTSFPHK